MTVNRTTLLNLPLPVTGTESGTWGDTTNNGLSQYMDIAIAGMTSLTSADFTAGALTLANTTGDSSATNIGASSAQYGAIKVSSLAVASTITAPSSNRRYVIINADATYNLTFKATGQTGVTLLPGQSAVVAFNGTDYVIVGTVGAGTATDNAITRFDGTTGEILQNSAATIDDTGAATFVGSVNVSGTSASGADLKLYEDTDNGTNYVAFKSPASVASNVTWTLPSADGTNGQALTTNGSGTLAFSSVTTAPGGSTTQVQYNNAGAFGGSANFVWDNSNVRLGIGTSSPNTQLDVLSGTANTAGDSLTDQTLAVTGPNRAFSTHVGVLNVATNTTAGVDVGGSIGFGGRWTGTTQAGFALIKGAKESAATSYASYLAFYTRPDSAAMSERMRIDSSGNVGIGVTPNASWWTNSKALQLGQGGVVEGRSAQAIVSVGANYYLNNSPLEYRYLTSETATKYDQIAGEHRFLTAPSGTAGNAITFTQVMTLNASGNLGIGTSSPIARLTVSDSTATNGTMTLGNNGSYYGGLQYTFSTGELRISQVGGASLGTTFYTNGSERMRIDSSGNVGIGTTPSYKLHVNGVTYADNFRVPNTTGYFYDIAGQNGMYIYGTAHGSIPNTLSLNTNGTERMRIDSSGSVGIGTSSPQARFQVTDSSSSVYIQDAGGVGWSGNPVIRNPANSGYLILMNGTTGGVGLTGGGTSWTSISDERYKTDLLPIENGLQKVNQLRSVTGRFINDEENKSRSFLIAQDVQQVLPEAISVADDGRMLLSYTDVIPLLVAAIKDLKAIVDAQAARIATLEGTQP